MHPALAFAGAFALHVLALGAAWRTRPAPHSLIPSVRDEVEIALLAEPTPKTATSVGPELPPTPSALARSARAVVGSLASALPRADGTEPEVILDSRVGEDPPVVPRATKPRVELGLDGSIIGRIVLAERKKRTPGRTTGLDLGAELDSRDAAKGIGRSSSALSAAYRASNLAPPFGSATFDVRADAIGRVTAVVLVEFGSDAADWRRVGEALKRQLQKKRLRIPRGARGLSSVLRIERGEMALDNRERGRTKRGAAIGQQSLGSKDVKDESTRASLENGRVAPSLGVGTNSVSTSPNTRVVLVRERPL